MLSYVTPTVKCSTFQDMVWKLHRAPSRQNISNHTRSVLIRRMRPDIFLCESDVKFPFQGVAIAQCNIKGDFICIPY